MNYNRFIEPSTLAEQQRLAGVEVTEAEGKYYVTKSRKGVGYELRQTRFKGRKKEHPHDVMAVSMTMKQMADMVKVLGPEAQAAVKDYLKSNPGAK